MNYHKRILNIPCMPESDYDYKGKEVVAYKKGFTDVKEPATEIVLEAEDVIEDLVEALECMLESVDMNGFGISYGKDLARSAIAKARREND